MKRNVKIGLVVLGVAIVLSWLMLNPKGEDDHQTAESAIVRMARMAKEIEAPYREFERLHPELVPELKPSDRHEDEAVRLAFSRMVDCYENNDFEGLQRLYLEISARVADLRIGLLVKYRKCLLLRFLKDVNFARSVREAGNAYELNAYLRTRMATARLLIDAEIRIRNIVYGALWDHEMAVLHFLRSYRNHYSEIGNQQLLEVAQSCYFEWKTQVESEDGYARRWFRANVLRAEYVSRGNPDKRKLWREDMLAYRRYLQDSEDRPSWIEEEVRKVFGDEVQVKGIEE